MYIPIHSYIFWNSIIGISLYLTGMHVRSHPRCMAPSSRSVSAFLFPCPTYAWYIYIKKRVGGAAFLGGGQTRLHPWVESVKLMINEPPSVYSGAPTRACGGSLRSHWDRSVALVVRKGLREGRVVGVHGWDRAGSFLLPGRCLVPGLNVLPRRYVDCMSLMDICLSKLIENTASRSSEILYKFLSSNPSSVLFYRHIKETLQLV